MSLQKKIDLEIIEEVYPEVLKNKDFRKWFQECYRRLEDIRDTNYRFAYNISEITFALHEYPNGEISKKFAIGVFGNLYDKGIKKLFKELFEKYCPQGKIWLKKQDLDEAYGVGIGYEKKKDKVIWKFYVMYPNGIMKAVNCGDGEFEEKEYRHSPNGRLVFVKGKHKRVQINIETKDKEAYKAIKLLNKYGYISERMANLAERIVLSGMGLDTISVSQRGLAIYFE